MTKDFIPSHGAANQTSEDDVMSRLQQFAKQIPKYELRENIQHSENGRTILLRYALFGRDDNFVAGISQETYQKYGGYIESSIEKARRPIKLGVIHGAISTFIISVAYAMISTGGVFLMAWLPLVRSYFLFYTSCIVLNPFIVTMYFQLYKKRKIQGLDRYCLGELVVASAFVIVSLFIIIASALVGCPDC